MNHHLHKKKMRKNIFFIVEGLYSKAGGLTSSIYKKASFLAEFHCVTILVINYQLHLEQILEELILVGKISKKVNVINIFSDVGEKNIKKNKKPFVLEYQYLLDNIDYFNFQKKDNSLRVFDENGVYNKFISYRGNGNIGFIDCMNSLDHSILEKRYGFYKNSLISLECFNNGEKKQQVIFNKNKCPILNFWFKDNKITRIFDMQTEEVIDSNEMHFKKQWISSVISTDDIVFVDSHFSRTAELLKNIECKKIAFIHSHQNYCNDTKHLIKNSDFEKYVFLTNLQREDFKTFNLDIYSKSIIIPHPYVDSKSNLGRIKKIVTVTRLVHNKPVIPVIYAFSKIINNFPDYIYEIYGVGPEKDNIEKIIIDLNLKDKVILRGYTNEALKIFEEAELSISLTKFEGFGLSILESLSMGCPVITSNVNYGPNEMVKNQINGHLVNNDDVDGISDAISKILSSPKEYQDNCLPSIKDHEINSWKERIISLIN
ncbi:glycosyltransferase [Comamonas sp.]|uniref:glycosyltransferase n=1 Tax=Comamonas sp. TaxID=34028 RepID=UPI002FC5A8E4